MLVDLTGVQEQGSPLPDGTYPVSIEKAEVALTKTPGGEMIKVTMTVTNGPGMGRKIFDQFNIKNANPKAVQIGLEQLKGMLRAFGHRDPNRLESTTELVGLKGTVKTKIEDNGNFAPQARVRAYLPSQASAGLTDAASTPSASVAKADPFA